MSPVFGHKDKEDDKQERVTQWRREIQGEVDRLNALPLTELAAEIMARGFAPGADADAIATGRGSNTVGQTVEDISFKFAPEREFNFPLPTIDDHKFLDQITKLIAEGVQELEHASLVLSQLHSSTARLHWTTTRRGRAAIQHGEVLGILQAARPAG